jgi:hypothetical protein
VVSVACGAAAKAEPAIRVRPRIAALSLFIVFFLFLGKQFVCVHYFRRSGFLRAGEGTVKRTQRYCGIPIGPQ